MVDYSSNPNGKQNGLKFRHILILLLIAFIGGAVLAGWAVNHYSLFGFGKNVAVAAPVASQNAPSLPAATVSASGVIAPNTAATQEVTALEGRMTQINADAVAASGNATRAEGMLVAFAARRAIDSGAPLGYVEDQLRLRFGGSQPQAVMTILNAAAAPPVTLGSLQGELSSIGNSLTTAQGGGIWARVEREMGELFVLRTEGTPSPAPTQKLKRAMADVDGGNIAAAISEVQSMPGAGLAKDWLAKARSYVATRKALDAIERSAIMVSGPLPAPAQVGTAAAQGGPAPAQVGPAAAQGVLAPATSAPEIGVPVTGAR
jgi:hypothetical protein